LFWFPPQFVLIFLHHSFCCHVIRRTIPYSDVFRFSVMVQTFAMRTGGARNSTDCMNATWEFKATSCSLAMV
jgi:hypothetical protein